MNQFDSWEMYELHDIDVPEVREEINNKVKIVTLIEFHAIFLLSVIEKFMHTDLVL